MAVFKCKMCGGALEIGEGQSIATCEYCGTPQTLPRLNDERRTNLYDRANHFRRSNDFDKASSIYEQILNEDATDAEAYWSLVLCRYGIEYVEDPATHKRLPTVNRMQYASILADGDYKSALQYADGYQRSLYEEEAKAIDSIQKGILAISQKEEPFDVFICYKETDANGRRTHDSVLAQELYYQLKQEGFKVFFSRITLEDKLGAAYEPYIFAALNSAKVMVVLGTKPEFFQAVWVKNEWSRYLAMIRGGAKKILIPAYKDMDPYDMPEEFSHLQAQDMSKLGFMQDLIRGIKKIVRADAPKAAPTAQASAGGNAQSVAPLLRRIAMFLEEGDWDNADAYCERVLDQAPESGEAYVMKTMARLHLRREEELGNSSVPLESIQSFKNALRFADEKTADRLVDYSKQVKDRLARIEADRQEQLRLAQERQAHEERLRQEMAELQQQRYALEEKKSGQMKEKSHLLRAIRSTQDDIKTYANPILLRLFGVFMIGYWFTCWFLFVIGVSEDIDVLGAWFFSVILFFVLFGVFSRICKHSFAFTFLNLPTIGFFSVIFSIIMIVKSFTKKRSVKEKELMQLNIRLSQAEQRIQATELEIQEMDRVIQAHPAYTRA